MDEKEELAELSTLLRSRVPIIQIATHEEPRVLKLLQQACNLDNQVLFRWSIVDGVCRHAGADRDTGIYQTNELRDALKHIDKTPQNGVYALCDAHPGLTDPVNVRLIRQIALSHFQTARTLVFISPRFENFPDELVRLSSVFRPRLPTRAEIRALIGEEAKLWESQSGEKPRAERGVIDPLIAHLTGLELEEVRRLVRQSFRADGELNRHDLRRVLAAKHEALGGSGVLTFEQGQVRFDDIGGLERMKHWIGLRHGPFIEAIDADAIDRPKGVLLLGVQGGGKSLVARAIAGQWGVPLMRLDVGALYNKYYGETERNVRQAFAAAEGMAPCVLWIDEIEKGVAHDGGQGDGGLSRRVLGALLTWLAERTRPVFIVATANDISQLPPELIRKGRFDEIFFVDFPSAAARAQIIGIHLRKRGLDPAAFPIDTVVARTADFSGAEIEQAIVAARFEAKARGTAVTAADILAEIERTRPLSVVMAERIEALRDWAADRAVFAADPEPSAG